MSVQTVNFFSTGIRYSSTPQARSTQSTIMPRIDDINVILGFQSLILDQVRAVHGPLYANSTFAVITSRFDAGIGNIEYTAQATVYTYPGSLRQWKLLVEGDAGGSTVQAMEGLMRKCQEEVGGVTEMMAVGWMWDGREVKRVEKE
ncbi:hypothetical protein HBH92_205560 [Parastagonospora nodorum]|nr:hypothetical protein HBH51_053560 [Parastagonospora nodorum]KAH4402932.1 hypothetical protein HBH92_205560 [Parastagonospora nodorum]KAH4416545.1 hypothetical protein HBH93_211750 [Parastagonospora nodorum]KAH4433038.1 hypothetical protein HBH91_220830 [Parastagonospora nodorum]KAH4513136.1 hypothetical protein HBH89_033780 [Parastagonospora nodorum]